jgi:hypothetical protein
MQFSELDRAANRLTDQIRDSQRDALRIVARTMLRHEIRKMLQEPAYRAYKPEMEGLLRDLADN